MTPHHWHATAAAWALQAARGTLTDHARAEAAQNDSGGLSTYDGLRSPVWGSRHALGGHSDPVGTLVLASGITGGQRVNEAATLADDITRRLALPAGHLPGDGDPLDRITTAIPGMLPGTAAALTRLLVRLDDRVRMHLRIGPARRLLTGVECPACRHRLVYEQTLGPTEAWTVVCAADCRCTGVGCRCGQPGAVEGVPHIWPRNAVIGAVAGATPSPTT
ncbi:hypothetical protein [Verrucosispora sp. NA02020]|uniref:hypothetical protein n=1 Tax=Verrucosispora sp. NA02020 TaxID=2742132 RepID=UPI003D7481C0